VTRTVKQWLSVLVYLLTALSPLIVLFVAPRPEGRQVWREMSVALAFVGLSLMGLQFVPTARLPVLANLFPLDAIYYFHHWSSVAALFLVLAHPIILIAFNPYTLRLLNLATAPGRARAGVVGLVAAVLLVLLSVYRKEIKVKYEAWRLSHIVFSLLAAGFGLYHILAVNHYMAMPALRILWIGLAVMWALATGYVRVVKRLILLKRPYEVKEVIEERGDSWTLVLTPVGHEGLTFDAGQAAWLTLGDSPFVIEEHPFSFSSSAEQTETLEFTVRELGDFTYTVGSIAAGTRAYVDGPYGTIGLSCLGDCGCVLIAGGVGSAPLMSIMRTLADRHDERPVLLFYGSRTWDEVIFREELDALENRLNLRVVHVLERPPDGWSGEVGYITAEVLERHLPDDRSRLQYLICGPPSMIRLVERSLRHLGAPRKRIHTELYEMA
jgi:predicted ferric reductase